MAADEGLERSIRGAISKKYTACPELNNFLARERDNFKVPLIAEMLQAIPWESQKDIIGRYHDSIHRIERALFDEIAAEWFSADAPKTVHGRYALIYELKALLKGWGFLDFYDRHKLTLPVNMNYDLFNQLNIFYCLDELCESHVNKVHAKPARAAGEICDLTNGVGDPKLSMIEAAEKTFFVTAMLNLQLKWMLELIDLSYMDGTMKASLDSEERERFEKMYQSMQLSTVDELMDIVEMFPQHASKESTSALRVLLKNADTEIMQRVGSEKRKLAIKRLEEA